MRESITNPWPDLPRMGRIGEDGLRDSVIAVMVLAREGGAKQ